MNSKAKKKPLTAHRRMQIIYHARFGNLCQRLEVENDDSTRYTVNEYILGYRKSARDMTTKEFSILIDQMTEWLKAGIAPHKLDQNTRNRRDFDQNKKQLIYVIEGYGVPEAMIQHIAQDKFGQRPWRDHGTFQLQRLRYTINRVRQRHEKKGQPYEEQTPKNPASFQSRQSQKTNQAQPGEDTQVPRPRRHPRRSYTPNRESMAHN